jgi:DNA polymerase
MIECACSDGRVRDILMYHGAGPGRWTGKGIQIQNFPRQGTLNLHQIIEDLEREPALFNLIHGPVGPALVKCLRGMIKAREGARFLNADYSSVEARFAAWITGDAKVLEIFHTHGKVYEANAASIFGMDVEDISKSSKERLIGKVSELAQTYQGGVRASVSMGRVYKLDMSIVAGVVLPTAASGEMKKSEDLVNMMFSEKSLKEMRITKDTAIALDIVKARWRASRPDITDAWYSLEDCAVKALEHPGSVFQWNGIYFGTTRDFLCMQLPSGRSLYYYKPKLKKVIPPWVDKELPMEEQMEQAKMTVTYLGAKGKGGMERIGMYGGKWLENICQGGCADLLFFSMLNLERGGYPVAFTVHDEVLAEVKNGQGTHEEFLELMTRLPEWAADFPLKAEGWEEDRFRK